MSAAEGPVVGLPPGLALCAKCGKDLKGTMRHTSPPRFPHEAIALFNNLCYLLLLRRLGKTKTYKIVGWR